jgi:hypothetical protein
LREEKNMAMGAFVKSPHAHRGGAPRDLREAGPSEEVARYYDPKCFEWEHEARKEQPLVVSIGKNGNAFRISNSASGKIISLAERTDDGYWVQIGIARGAFAIRPAHHDDPGAVRARQARKGNAVDKGLYINCRAAIAKLPSHGRFVAEWDEHSQMLVAKLPKEATR